MKLRNIVCTVIGHRWADKHGSEGENYLMCRRCGAIGDKPGSRIYPM